MDCERHFTVMQIQRLLKPLRRKISDYTKFATNSFLFPELWGWSSGFQKFATENESFLASTTHLLIGHSFFPYTYSGRLKIKILSVLKNTNEPGHEKMCLMAYVNNEGADQPAHPCSLIRAFVVRCLDSIIYWTKVITQLINGSISVWICDVGQSIWDILLNYSQRIFGAQWVTSLHHGCLNSNLIGQNGFLSPRRLPRG